METKKIYETDGMCASCDAVVTGTAEKGGNFYITLDQSIFAPEGGGQKADTGLLYAKDANGNASKQPVRLLDGHEKVKDVSLTGPVYLVDHALSAGDKVLCKLDWEQRFMRMQQHSGEHILSGLIHQHFGYDNISFHLSDTEPVIMCFSGPLTDDDLLKMERLANEAVWQDLPIEVSFPSKEELGSIMYRSKKELEGQVRLVKIPGIDVCACCAPHVPTTGRIGLIKILSSQSYKQGGTQLNVLCGKRALELVEAEHELLMGLQHAYSSPTEKLSEVILAQQDELKRTREELSRFVEQQLLSQIASKTQEDAPVVFGRNLSVHAMKIAYNALCAKFDRYCGVFSLTGEDSYQFYAGHPEHDSTRLAKIMREELQALGGGSKDMIQGKVQKKEEEIRLFFLQDLLS